MTTSTALAIQEISWKIRSVFNIHSEREMEKKGFFFMSREINGEVGLNAFHTLFVALLSLEFMRLHTLCALVKILTVTFSFMSSSPWVFATHISNPSKKKELSETQHVHSNMFCCYKIKAFCFFYALLFC